MSTIEFISATSRQFYFYNSLILVLNPEKHFEIATIDKFQLDLKKNYRDAGK